MLAWERVNEMKTPSAYSGISACVSPPNTMTSPAAVPPRMRMPLEKTSRSPRVPNCRGMNPSRARKYDSLGKSANDVLAARIRMSIVTAWIS